MNWIAEKIYQVPITKIRPYEKNARTHSDHQITLLMKAIQEFGFTTPILMTSDGTLVAGHGRSEAAKRLGLETVPAIYVDHLSERQRKALVLADNKITSLAGWDFSVLAEELNDLAESNFDLELTGFNEEELDSLLRDTVDLLPETFVTAPEVSTNKVSTNVADGLTDDDYSPELVEHKKPITKPGDVWILGDHRLMCGDSLKGEDIKVLMVGVKADMVFTDPPYNVSIAGLGVSGSENSIGSLHGEFKMASGEMSEQEFTEFLRKVFTNLAANSKDGAINYVCMDWRHMKEVLDAATAYETRADVGGGIVGTQTADSLE